MIAMQDVLLRVGRLNYVWTNTESLFIYLIAYLMRTDKQAAIVVFLTLNTTRARIDLIQRLAKLKRVSPGDKNAIVSLLGRLSKESAIRNKLNHCIYSFDADGSISTQLMRISDLSNNLRYGKIEAFDEAEIDRIDDAIGRIIEVNRDIWSFLTEHSIKY